MRSSETPIRFLEPDEVEELVDALLEVDRVAHTYRTLLMSDIARGLWNAWPTFAEPVNQARSDLKEMARLRLTGSPADHPLAVWLENARRLCRDHPVAETFGAVQVRVQRRLMDARRAVHPGHRRPRASIVDGAPSKSASRSMSLYRTVGGSRFEMRDLTVSLSRVGDMLQVDWSSDGMSLHLPSGTITSGQWRSVPGAELWPILFAGPNGIRGDPGAVLCALGVAADPRACSLRLRVRTDDPELAALPWHELSYEGEALIGELGWSVELVRPHASAFDVHLPRDPLLVVYGHRLSARDIHGALAITAPIDGQRPRVISADDPVSLLGTLKQSVRPLILADLDTDRAASRLRQALQASADEASAPAAICAIGEPCATVPLYMLDVAPLYVRFTEPDAAIAWLLRVINDGLDPVLAACGCLHDDPASLGSTDAARPPVTESRARRVLSAYRRWRSTPSYVHRPPAPWNVLDRTDQREVVLARLESMRGESHRHLQVIVASGLAEHRIDLLPHHLEHHVRARMSATHLRVVRPVMPRVLDGRIEDGADRMSSSVAAALNEPDVVDAAGIARRFTPNPLPGSTEIVWFDWGAYGIPGTGDREERLRRVELRLWLGWHIDLAAHLKQRKIRAAAFIACQTTDWQALARELDAWAFDTDLTSVEFTLLPPLRRVTVNDLRQYLNHLEMSRVDPTLVGPLTRAIAGESPAGHFDDVARHLDRGHRVGWLRLLRELTGRWGRHDDDEEQF